MAGMGETRDFGADRGWGGWKGILGRLTSQIE